jgi:hypothetical protein
MAARVESNAAALRKVLDDLVPNAGVESGGVTKENGRSVAWPLPNGDLDSMDGHSGLPGRARHASLV